MASKSYWSYGKVNHKDGALIIEGRVLIDTARALSTPRRMNNTGFNRTGVNPTIP